MPELPEIEAYRELAQARALRRTITEVQANDLWYLKAGVDPASVSEALLGHQLLRARRRGKLLLLDVGRPVGGSPQGAAEQTGVLGLRFGMTGRLVVDQMAGVEELLYSTRRHEPTYHRFGLSFVDGGHLIMNDPRRLGGVLLDPVEDRLGPDARGVTLAQLRHALSGATGPLKARLMDQTRLAGIGNLLADEILWRAALSPHRIAGTLTAAELRRLRVHVVATVEQAIEGGGSHTGELMVARRRGGLCPRDGTPLARDQVGGRTTWWCPRHQH